jgi:hypothetical protein
MRIALPFGAMARNGPQVTSEDHLAGKRREDDIRLRSAAGEDRTEARASRNHKN